MCIIAREVESVGATQIFVAPDAKREYQITVYSNVIENSIDNNTMILPVCNPNTVAFIDLSNYPSFFKDCKDCFMEPPSRSKSFDGARSGRKTLEVHRVGGYVASIAKSLDEIKQADTSVFDIPDDCIKVLNTYPADYGFIICKLEKGKKEYHPFAYTHAITDTLFIPTKHYHAHKKKTEKDNIHKMLFPEMHTTDDYEKFDHDIYIYNGIGNERHFGKSNYILDKSKVSKITNNLPFDLAPLKSFKKYKINGFLENIDLTANIIYTSNSSVPTLPKEKVNEYVNKNPSSIKSKTSYCCIN